MSAPTPTPPHSPTPESDPSNESPQDRLARLDTESKKALDKEVGNSKAMTGVLLFMLVVLVMIGIFSSAGRGTPEAGDAIIIARSNDVARLDPQSIDDIDSGQVCDQIYEGLVQFAPGADSLAQPVQPCLAEKWTVSADELTYEFELRRSVYFHDGAMLTNAAVKRSFDRLLNPDSLDRGKDFIGQYAGMYDMIDRIEAPTDNQFLVRFVLKQKSAVFLKNLAMNPAQIISPWVLQEIANGNEFMARGTGAFMIEDWRRGEALVLKRFTRYWGDAPAPSRLIFRVIPNPEQRLTALRADEVHLISAVDPMHVAGLRQETARFRVHETLVPNVMYLGMNPNAKVMDANDAKATEPTIANPLAPDWLREAISLAIDKRAIVQEVYRGLAVPANSIIPPNVFGTPTDLADTTTRTEKRLDAARTLVTSNGFGPQNMVKVPLYSFPESRPYLPSPSRPYLPSPPKFAAEVKRQLRDAYIDVEIKEVPWATYKNEALRGVYPFFILGWQTDNGDPDNFLAPLFGSPGGKPEPLNAAKWVDGSFQENIETAARTLDRKNRANLYAAAELRMRQAHVCIPIAHATIVWIGSAKVEGFFLHPMGLLGLDKVKLVEPTTPQTQDAQTQAGDLMPVRDNAEKLE